MKIAKKVAVWKSGIIEVDLYTASFIYVNISPLRGHAEKKIPGVLRPARLAGQVLRVDQESQRLL